MKEKERDLFILGKESKIRSVVSPRVILLTRNGDFPLVPYENTGWYGLPGGKIKIGEADGNFLSLGSFPTLTREVMEECGVDISDHLTNSCCLGLAEIGAVDNTEKRITFYLSPIFLFFVPDLKGTKQGVAIVNLNSHMPWPLFPDVRMGITYLRESIKEQKRGKIFPEFLNEEIYYFQLRPEVGLLMGPPKWK